MRIVAIIMCLALAGCAGTLSNSRPCLLSEQHAQDKVVSDHPVERTPLPKHVDQNIQDRQDLKDAVSDYNDLRRHVLTHCQ